MFHAFISVSVRLIASVFSDSGDRAVMPSSHQAP